MATRYNYYDELSDPNALNSIRQQSIMDRFGAEDYGTGGMPVNPADVYDLQGNPDPTAGFQMPVIRNPAVLGIPPPEVPTYKQPDNKWDDPQALSDLINKFYTPSTRAGDRLNALLDQFPQREAPSLGRKLVASVGAFGTGLGKGGPTAGLDFADRVLDEPHTLDMKDWLARAGPYQQAATLENQQNVNERNLAGNAATNFINQQRYGRQGDIAAFNADTARIRANAYDYKQRNPTHRMVVANDHLYAYDPASNQVTDLGQAGHFTHEDAVRLNVQGRLAGQEMMANATAAAQIGSQEFQSRMADINRQNDLWLKQQPAPNQVEEVEQNKLRAYYSNPDFRPYITPPDRSRTGKWELAERPSGGFLSQPSQDQLNKWQHVYDDVFHPTAPPQPSRATPPTRPPIVAPKVGGQQQQQQPEQQGYQLPGPPPSLNFSDYDTGGTPAGRSSIGMPGQQTSFTMSDQQKKQGVAKGTLIEVIDPQTGQVGTIPANQWPQAQKKGYIRR